jgi:hypothetical protein
MEENTTQTTEIQEPEKKERKKRSVNKIQRRKRRGPNVPKIPLGLLNEPTAKESEIKKSSTPWKPARMLEIPENLKDSRFTYRWCNRKRVGNMEKKVREGWEVDTILSKKLNELYGLNRTIEDGSPIDSTVNMRELIIMRMPKEMTESRNEYYRKRSQIDRRSIQKGMRKNIEDEPESASDPANVLGRSTIYGERKLERI